MIRDLNTERHQLLSDYLIRIEFPKDIETTPAH